MLPIKDMKGGAGKYFKPADHGSAKAVLIEVHRFERQVPTARYGPKDTIYADITVFATDASLDSGTPTETFTNTTVQQTVLVKNLTEYVGAATVATLTQLPPQNGNQPAWAWASVSEDVKAKVVAYAKKREAERQAAIAAAPDFD